MEAQQSKDDALMFHANGPLGKRFSLKPADIDLCLEAAQRKIETGRLDQAMDISRGLVLCDPLNVKCLAMFANCANLLGENDVALQAASAVVALQPENPLGYLYSGEACLSLGHVAEAGEDAETAFRLSEKVPDPRIRENSAMLLERVRRKKAVEATRQKSASEAATR